MIRIALMVARLFFIAPYYFWKICKYSKYADNYPENERYEALRYVTKKANWAGRVTIKSYGIDNIPDNNGFILFPNHQGMYDVLSLLDSCPVPFTIVMKKEAGNIILLKQVIGALKGQLIDRKDVKQAMKVILKMAEEVKEGRNYLIFAEGTRSKNKNELLDFHAGSFKSAIHAKCPIVPVALIDSYKPFDESSIKPVTVQVHYLKPILYEEYKDMKSKDIAGIVKSRIEETIRNAEVFNI